MAVPLNTARLATGCLQCLDRLGQLTTGDSHAEQNDVHHAPGKQPEQGREWMSGLQDAVKAEESRGL